MDDEDDDSGENDLAPAGIKLLTREEILEHALAICQEFKNDGVTLTVRGLYYKLIGRGIVSPEELAITDGKGKVVGGDRLYKRVGKVCSDARYEGDMPMDHLIDEGRDVYEGAATRQDDDVDLAHDTAGEWIKTMHRTIMATDRWFQQPKFVSLWVEKQGLTSALRPVCDELGVTFFACKGYPSVTALWDWLQMADFAVNGSERIDNYRFGDSMQFQERHVGGLAQEAIILYAGDADPDGYEIPRSAERGLRKLMDTYGCHVPLRFERIALNVDQARELHLPPFQAKTTSARYKKFQREHQTDDAWEIDALDLRMLRDWVREGINRHWDPHIGAVVREEADRRAFALQDRIADPNWLHDLFE